MVSLGCVCVPQFTAAPELARADASTAVRLSINSQSFLHGGGHLVWKRKIMAKLNKKIMSLFRMVFLNDCKHGLNWLDFLPRSVCADITRATLWWYQALEGRALSFSQVHIVLLDLDIACRWENRGLVKVKGLLQGHTRWPLNPVSCLSGES